MTQNYILFEFYLRLLHIPKKIENKDYKYLKIQNYSQTFENI